jgi:cellulose synthase (UDP-forming)
MWQIFWLKNPWRLKGLSVMQRLLFTHFSLFWGFPVSRLCLMFMPIIALLWGVTLADAPVTEVLSYCLPAIIGSVITGQYLHGRFRWPFISHLYEVIQSVHLARSEIRMLGNIRAAKFAVTPKAEVLEQDFLSGMAKPFYILLTLSLVALIAGAIRLAHQPEQRDMLLFISFWALIDFIFLLGALGVTFERKQRRTEPRPPAESPARLQITPVRVQAGELTDASASGAGMVTANHSDVWLAFIHKRAVRLTLGDGPTFEARIQKVTQLTDGRVAVGLSYQMHSTESERFAISIAYGSSQQLEKNLRRRQHRKNAVAMFLMLLQKTLVLGCGHLFFLLSHTRQSMSSRQVTPRLLWEKKNETSSIYLPGDAGTVSHDELADRVVRPS